MKKFFKNLNPYHVAIHIQLLLLTVLAIMLASRVHDLVCGCHEIICWKTLW